MRSLIIVTILCFTSTPAFACVFDTDCKPGTSCVDGTCSRDLLSGSGDDDVPVKRAPTGKTCDYGDCDQGSRCIKGSGPLVSAWATDPITLIHCIDQAP
jgi:hypothetical protein